MGLVGRYGIREEFLRIDGWSAPAAAPRSST